MSYAIEALKCEKERVLANADEIKAIVTRRKKEVVDSENDLMERMLRIKDIDDAILMLASEHHRASVNHKILSALDSAGHL